MVQEASLGLSVTAHLGFGKGMVCAEPLQMQVLRDALLGWWQEHGRHTIPWKLRRDGALLCPDEQLDPYAIWVAEVMRAARQHSQTTQSVCSGPDRLCTPGLRAILRFEVFP